MSKDLLEHFDRRVEFDGFESLRGEPLESVVRRGEERFRKRLKEDIDAVKVVLGIGHIFESDLGDSELAALRRVREMVGEG